jgi:hypothetical protein
MRLMLVVASVALMPALVFAGPAAAAMGGNKAKVQQCKQSGSTGFSNRGRCVSSGARGMPAPGASLQIEPTVSQAAPCDNQEIPECWGTLVGSGLKPGTTWFVSLVGSPLFPFASGDVFGTGDFQVPLNMPCSTTDVVAVATTAAGNPITSPVAVTPSDCDVFPVGGGT